MIKEREREMGFWIGTAAVGYVTKCWQKLFSRKSSSKSIPADSVHGKTEINADLGFQVASTSGKDCEGCQAPLIEYGREKIDGLSGELVSDLTLTGKCGYLQRFQGRRNHRSCSTGYAVKLPSPLESSSLTAQFLYGNHTRMEDYVYSPFSSPCTMTVSPLMVKDGSRRISINFNKKTLLENGDEVQNLRGLEKYKTRLRSVEYARIRKQNVRRGRYRRRSNFATRAFTEPVHSQGSSKGMVLFFLGVTVGMVSTIIATKREMDKLNEQLKQTQNLVEDLNEELVMKDLLMVKELTNDGSECQGTYEHSVVNGISTAFSPERKLDKVAHCGSKESDDIKAYYSEERSKIEAELEAELELLELNIKKSSLQRTSHYDMVDSYFGEDEFQGDLKLDKLNWDLDHGKSRTPISHTSEANAVSPWELSFHLHEIIQSRLQDRIMELERELENSQKMVQSMDLEKIVPKRNSYSELGSQSTEDIPAGIQEVSELDCHLTTNLSEELNSSNQAYEETNKMTKMNKEAPTDTMCFRDCIHRVKHPFDKKPSEGQNGGDNFFTSHYGFNEERWSRFLNHDKITPWEESFPGSFRSSKIAENADIDEGDEDEIDKHLIKKIVEKSRRGYHPSVLNAQRLFLCSIDDDKILHLEEKEYMYSV
ncbi:hypothetical protein FEM48_Zijuj10G0098200 [Ziziphus jujuba var. spinosa]|uniref:Uncharacterized protein n=1 Tax=Ziziphus jujuba var. spinosa TaxID=714518 RepID=A0A978UMP1_ZIZJJ|nr:hypothetical protein FEM48_Zijuj10G0098200 [Ziziphus jujuba var. spinosa]